MNADNADPKKTVIQFGPFANDRAPSQTIHISDPVAAVSYLLDPRAQVARKMPPMRFKFEYKIPPPDGQAGEADFGLFGSGGHAYARRIYVQAFRTGIGL